MSEPYVEVDWVFYFTSGETLYATVREGRDTTVETDRMIEVTVQLEDGSASTLSIQTDKLNASQRTHRLVTPEPDYGEQADAVTV